MTEASDKDGFDLLAAAAARVLRRAFEGAAEMRAADERPEQLLQQLEHAVAAVLREAHLAADDIVGRPPSSPAPPGLSVVATADAASVDEDVVRLKGGVRRPPGEAPVGPVVLRRRPPS